MAPDGDRVLAEKADALADAIEAALGPWVVASVRRVAGDRLRAEADAAAGRATAEVVPQVRALLATDIDDQVTTPLALLRAAARYPTEVIRQAGVPPVARDAFARRAFPDDDYDLTPAAFEDVAPELKGPGLEWGAAKAFVHLARRRAEGRS
jgi:hypothetical protein